MTESDDVDAPLAARLAAIATQARETNRQRVDRLAEAVDRWADLDDEAQTSAVDVAHALAGSAGTFGYRRVSEIARELEASLSGGAPAEAPALVARLRAGLAADPEE